MTKDRFYFSHDYNARADVKIRQMIAKHGYVAYGLFWAIIEDLYQNDNKIPLDYECLAYDYRCSTEVIKSIINDFDLFKIENSFFGSISVSRRLSEREARSEKARKSAAARWGYANAMRPHSDRNAIKERKGKEIKVKDSKKESKGKLPTLADVEKYFSENGYEKHAAKKMYDYYTAADWIDRNGKPVKNWKLKAIGVWFKEENKIQPKKMIY